MAKNRRIGYQTILEAFGQDGWTTALGDYLMKSPGEPFIAEIGFSDCHRRGELFPPAGPAQDARFVRPPAPLPDEPRTREEFAGYAAMAARFDMNVGRLLGALDASGLADNTIVVLTTDHGVDFPHMKSTLRDDGIGVFLMIRGPRGSAWRGGRIVDAMVSQTDVFPTLCELTGTPPPARLQGRSLAPLVSGDAETLHDAVFASLNYHAAYQPMRCARTARWKYIRRYYDWTTPIPPNQAPCPSRTVWEEHGWLDRPEPREELYDLIYDPGEARNLVDDPDLATTVVDMRSRLQAWLIATADPLLHGHVPLVEGGQTVVWDELSNHGRTADAATWNAWLTAHESSPLAPPSSV
jgi:arylsulfatase A-like enzyme